MASTLRNVAIVGFSHAPIVERDQHRTAQELLYLQVRKTLADAGVARDAIDTQIAGSADYVDGKPFGFVQSLDVMGAWPARRDSHLEMDAAFAVYYAWLRIQAGESDTAMVVGYGKVSEGDPDAVSQIRLDPYYAGAIGLEATSTAALQASAFAARTGAGDEEFARVAAERLAAAAKNPDGLALDPQSADEIRKTPWVVEPLRAGYLAPTGDTACCLLLAAEEKAREFPGRPVWIEGIDQRAEIQTLGARDISRSESTRVAAERACRMAEIPGAQDVDLIELTATNPAEDMILCESLGIGEDGPVVAPSGGAFSGNPFMQTGLIRLGEAFRQLSGGARANPLPSPRRAIVHATQGHALQQNQVVVLGTERRAA